MRTSKLNLILASLFILLSASVGFTASTHAGDQPVEASQVQGKHLGVKLTGNPSALHKVLIGFKTTPGNSEEAIVHSMGGKTKYIYHLVPAIAATIPESAIEGLLRNPNVTHIDRDGTVRALDTELQAAWGVEQIGAGTVHGLGNKGNDVKVAIIDSGIDYTHPDLSANFKDIKGKNFAKNSLLCDYTGENDIPMDDNGHGTHVAGTVAAVYNSSGVVGVAPEVTLYALKVLDCMGSGDFSDVIAALQWSVDNGIQVTNNSYGSDEVPGQLVRDAFYNSYNAGILHVAAAGNSGNAEGTGDNVGYPARYIESVIAVAATDRNDVRASFSSTGSAVELAAPGVGIYSTCGNQYSLLCLFYGYCDYATLDGTSMASPHVAGTAALVIASGISDTNGNKHINDEVRQRLVETAVDHGADGRDPLYGYGLVYAVKAASSTTPPSPTNNPLVAYGDVYSTNEDTTLAVPAPGVLGNDSDADGNPLTALLFSGPRHGVLTLYTNGSFAYTPNLNFNGSDSFTYKANDGTADSNTATVSITAASVNDPPVANDDQATTTKNKSVTINVISNDYDVDGSINPNSVKIVIGPRYGKASALSNGNGTVSYTPRKGFTGTDSFTYTVKDNSGAISNPAKVTVTVQ